MNQPKTNNTNGPIRVNDPYDQLTTGYLPGHSNQPILRNIGCALEHQAFNHNNGHLTKYTFTVKQERFLVSHFKYNYPEMYNKVVKNPKTGLPT
jgi:hypothetical protein